MRQNMPVGENCQYFRYCSHGGTLKPPCPTRRVDVWEYRNRNPLSPAEDLCISALERVGRSTGRDRYKDACEDVQDKLDLSLALTKHSKKRAVNTFTDMTDQLYSVLGSGENYRHLGREGYYARMRTIEAFLPAFRDRLLDGAVSQKSTSVVHANMCSLLSGFSDTYVNVDPRPHRDTIKHTGYIRDEWEQMALLTRLDTTDYFPWPPTGREEASEGRSEHNHDYYCLDANSRKIPIQVKRSKRGSGYTGVTKITHFDITRAIRETTAPEGSKYANIPTLTELLVDEHKNSESSKYTRNVLNLASVYIISRIDAHADFRRD